MEQRKQPGHQHWPRAVMKGPLIWLPQVAQTGIREPVAAAGFIVPRPRRGAFVFPVAVPFPPTAPSPGRPPLNPRVGPPPIDGTAVGPPPIDGTTVGPPPVDGIAGLSGAAGGAVGANED